MNIQEFTEKLKKVAEQYAKEFGVTYDADWYFLKLQEELGEATQKHLIATGRTRRKPVSVEQGKTDLADELADTLGYLLLLANHLDVDLEEAAKRKWFKHLPTS